jgi:hypothetical protein
MASKESKTLISGLKGKWIWLLASISALVMIYAIYIAYGTNPDTEYLQTGDQVQLNNSPTGKVAPLHEYFLSIQKSGADFNSTIVSAYPKPNLDSIPPQKAALYLGVYVTDIGYLSTYGRTQEALNYMDVCPDLAEMICGEDAHDYDAMDRFEKNLSNPDSLNQVLSQFNRNVISYLLEHEHRDLGLLMLLGGFIEAQYITTQIIKDYPEDLLPDDVRWQVLSPLISIVMDQEGFLWNLIKDLEKLEGKGEWELASLNSLQTLYRIYTKPPSLYYPPPQEPSSYNKILLLTEYIYQLRANLNS